MRPERRAATTPRYVVDGAFLATRPTGLHRVARALTIAAKDAGVDLAVWAPRGTTDPLVDRTLRAGTGRLGRRLWEQAVLPTAARGHTIVSLTNTSPLLAPGVVLVHDLAPVVGPEWFAGSMRAYAKAVLATARRARLVITVSQAVRGELIDAGVSAERIVVIRPALDPRFAPASSEGVDGVRRKFGLQRAYVVMVGRANPRKDAATAVAAHRAVVDGVPHDLVLVGGQEPTFAPVRLPDLASVRTVGHVGDDDLVGLLSGARVSLYPTRYEGFGLPPLESLGCGTPVVVSDIPVLRESLSGLARFEPVGDVTAWAEALSEGLAGRLACPAPPLRPWLAAGQELAAALSSRLSG